MRLRKIIALLLAVFMLPIPNSFTASAAGCFEIPLTVCEQNGIAVNAYFSRRGIPLERGALFSADDAYIISADESASAAFTAEEFYSDGSIKWLNAAIVTDLKPNESKRFVVTNSPQSRTNGKVSYNKRSKILENQKLKVQIGALGIESIVYDGNEMLSQPMNMYAVSDGKTYLMKPESYEAVKSTDIYARIKVKGRINSVIDCEYILTLADRADILDVEYRITPLTDITLQSVGMTLETKTKPDCGDGISRREYVRAGAAAVISHDNARFAGAVTRAVNTGFEAEGNVLRVCPIVNNTSFLWYDGVTRTNHLYISFSGKPDDALLNIKRPPSVTVDTKQYVKAGLIETDEMSPVAERMLEGVEWLDGRLDGIFDAGAVPYRVDIYSDVIGVRNTRPGEVEYHLGYAYMASGSDKVYNIMQTSAEDWADVEIYKGGQDLIVGANRYKTADGYGSDRYFMSHPFYGDPTGLYMAYVLSGNEYLREVFKTCVDYIYKIMYAYPNSGGNYPRMFDWNSKKPNPTRYAECRYLIQAKGQYIAYNLFKNPKYREASRAIAEWGEKTQSPQGFFYQAYYDDGTPFIHGTQSKPPVKNYVMLYGFRGITDVFEYEVFDVSKRIAVKASDWLCSENETYGQGLWRPCGNTELYPSDEDGGRGKEGKTDIMAVSVLFNTYRQTKNERYLKNMLSLLETFMCEQSYGGICLDANYTRDCSYGGGIGNLCGGMNYTLFKIAPSITKFVSENRDYIIKLGYEDIAVAFSPAAKKSETVIKPVKYVWPEMNEYAYSDGKDEVLLSYNVNGFVNSEYDKLYETVAYTRELWQGPINKIKSPYEKTLAKFMKHYDCLVSIKRPVFIDSLTNPVEAEIKEYNENGIILEVSGEGKIALRIESGRFEVLPGEKYGVSAETQSGKTTITVKKGGNITADQSGAVRAEISLSDMPQGSEVSGVSEISENIKSVTGNTVTISEKPSYEELSKTLIPMLYKDKKELLDAYGISGVSFCIPAQTENTDEELKKAADALILDCTEPLEGDMELPHVSLYNTAVSWESDNPGILADDGTLNRAGITDENSVSLTATLRKNGAELKKTFDIPLRRPSDIQWNPNGNFPDAKHMLYPKSGDFEWKFTLIPKYDSTNALLSITDTDLPASANTHWPIIVRLNPNGYFDAYSSTDYVKENTVNYIKYKPYDFRVIIRQEEKRYDVYVTPDGGEEILLAKDCGFRETAGTVRVFDACYLISNVSYNDCFELTACNLVYPTKGKTRTFAEYDDFGLLFGKYVSGNTVALKYANGRGRINWICGEDGAVTSDGSVIRGKTDMTVTMYGLSESSFREVTFTDFAKALELAPKTAKPADVLTDSAAAEIIRKLQYIYK